MVYVMESKIRHIIWLKEDTKFSGNSIRIFLERFPAIEIVKCEGRDYAVVYMDGSTAQTMRQTFPDLCIEEDVPYALTALR